MKGVEDMKGFARRMAAMMVLLTLLSGVARAENELPPGLQRIGEEAFAGCGLKAVTLPASLEYIHDTAFDGAPLERVEAEAGSYAREWAEAHGYLETPYTPVRVQGIEVEHASFLIGEKQTWTVVAADGRPPYEYAFTLTREGEAVAGRDYSGKAGFSHTFLVRGDYVLAVRVQDAEGWEAQAEYAFTVTPKLTKVKGVIRVYLEVDKKGRVLRKKANTGHYELELADGENRFDGHAIDDPVLSYAPGSGGAGEVTVYGGDTVPYTGVKLYTFSFETTRDRADALLKDLKEKYLNTTGEKKAKHGYVYRVAKGPYKKYKVRKANCFTAVAAWCKSLGYRKLSKIAARAGSYTDYLAWKLYDKMGKKWKYRGRY